MSTRDPSEPEDDAPAATPPAGDGRRKFLKVGVGVVGAGVACIAGAPAVGFLLFPVKETVTSGGNEFVVVAKRDAFSPDVPVKVDVYADVVDAWNRLEHVRLGSVWIVEREGKLVAFSTVCPHLGCAIDFTAGEGGGEAKFECPCHRSEFSLDGVRESGPAPRDLDRIPLEVDDAEGVVAVMYKRFRQGIETQEEV
jgi:Rieske Fe-S protein